MIMLKELIKYNSFGSVDKIKFLMTQVILNRKLTVSEIKKFYLRLTNYDSTPIDGMVALLKYLKLISFKNNLLLLNVSGLDLVNSKNNFNEQFIILLINSIIYDNDELIINFDKIKYDLELKKFVLNNSNFNINYSNFKNFLIKSKYLTYTKYSKNIFIVDDLIISLLNKKNKKSLNQLKENLKLKEEMGKIAEDFVLEYELKRLKNHSLFNKISIISNIDVSAGFDIVSFESIESKELDRFIEVKSYNKFLEFYWSKNEIEISKKKRKKYYLYLVDRSRILEKSYVPKIIRDPYSLIFCNENDWVKETVNWKFYIK